MTTPGTRRLSHERHALDLVERRFRDAFAVSPIGMALVDTHGRFAYVNHALCGLLGRPREELLELTWQDVTHPEDVSRGESYMLDAVAGIKPQTQQQKRYVRPDGSYVWALVSTSLITEEDGTPACFFSQIVDIHEHKKAEEAVRRAERKHRALVERLPGIVYTAEGGARGRWYYVSPQLTPILGYEPEDWLADPSAWLNAVHPEDRERVVREEEAEWGEGPGSTAYSEYRMVASDGRVVYMRDEAAIVQEEAGAPPLWQGILVDVTHAKQLEEQVRHALKMEAVGVLAGGAAHNFNNLLAVIQNYAGFVMETLKPDDARRDDMGEILAASRRASKLVRDLLAFSRDERAQAVTIQLNDVVTGMASLLATTLGGGIRLSTRLDPDLPAMRSDAGQIEQVLLNLVLNARDALHGEGEIVIETGVDEIDVEEAGIEPARGSGSYVCFSVSDNGCGMSPEVQQRIFEPFFTTKGMTGTGLGLASVYGIVKQWRGHIAVDSQVGRGTTFRICLPRAD
jgi:two-component system cell cycle sensor histidine kinase/response regulator CckA